MIRCRAFAGHHAPVAVDAATASDVITQGAANRQRKPSGSRATLLAWLATSVLLLVGCEKTDSVQRGYRGLSMEQLYKPSQVAKLTPLNAIPAPEEKEPPDPEAPAIKDVFKNVLVLNDLTVLEFSRLMQAMSTWIAPEEGCAFCHNTKNLASDEKYTKVVARKMLAMTRDINTNWKTHVAGTGVTCWTCHRGQAVPAGDWFANPRGDHNMLGTPVSRPGQNVTGISTQGYTSLPSDPLSKYLVDDTSIRVQGTQALAGDKHDSIYKTRTTYGLMVYMANSLGVNCTYCHNTRALSRWEESTPQRATAWYGIRMVRDLNVNVLNPIKPLLPGHRLSADGDGPKVGCATCHKGSYKPLYGVSMLGDYPELAGVMVRPPAESASAPALSASAAAALGDKSVAPPAAPSKVSMVTVATVASPR
jgi:Photosynthetic reaction centre cytochrome C subunit